MGMLEGNRHTALNGATGRFKRLSCSNVDVARGLTTAVAQNSAIWLLPSALGAGSKY